MIRSILATNQPNHYQGIGNLAKSDQSLGELARTKRIPIRWGSHTGAIVGFATDLKYQAGKLTAYLGKQIPAGWGCSLEYTGEITGSLIQIQPDQALHVAILPNPRDHRTIMSDSTTMQKFRDSEDPQSETPADAGTTGATESSTTPDPATIPNQQPQSVEIPADAISQILSNSDLVDAIVSGMLAKLQPTLESAPEPQPEPQPEPKPVAKVTYRAPATEILPPKPVYNRPTQQQFKGIK